MQKVTNPGCFLRKTSPCAQNVPLRVTGLGGDGGGRGAGAGFVRPPGLPVGYLGRIRRHGGRHGLRRLRAQAIRAAHVGTGDGVTGAGGVVRDDRRTRRQKTGDGQAHLLLGAPEESRTRRQNGGGRSASWFVLLLVGCGPRLLRQVGAPTQPCFPSYGFPPGLCARWAHRVTDCPGLFGDPRPLH